MGQTESHRWLARIARIAKTNEIRAAIMALQSNERGAKIK
nr:MAG TPA: hypothetical protein [Caudoviricetes sp.]